MPETTSDDQLLAPKNPALTGGVFRSGEDHGCSQIAAIIDNDDDAELAPAEGDVASPASPRSWGFDVENINENYALTLWGSKAIVVNTQSDAPPKERIRLLTLEAMNSWFGNKFTETVGADNKVKVVTWAKAWHSHRNRRSYPGVEFFPNPDKALGTPGYLNLWQGFAVSPSAIGSCDIFRDHLLNNVCNGDERLFAYVFGWMAHIVQRPRERLGTALVLRGKMGTGKSKIGEILGSLFPAHYCQVDDARYVTGQYNAHMASNLLLQADEAVWAGDKAAEGRLKGLITASTQMVEPKNIDPIQMPNYQRVLMTSNEGWVVPAGLDERRYCVLDVADHRAKDHPYFIAMDDQMNSGGRERLLYELINFDLSKVDLWTIPKTRALLDQKIRSFDPVDGFWYNCLLDGALLAGDSDWSERVVSSALHNEYIKASAQMGIGRKRSPAEFGARLHKLVPNLRKVRISAEVAPGVAGRPWCYEIPPLTECRAAFDAILGQTVDWPAPSAGGSRASENDELDDDIPF